MRKPSMGAAPAAALIVFMGLLLAPSGAAWAAGDAEIAELRGLIESMRADYEARIADLEARLERAEAAAQASEVEPRQAPAPTAPKTAKGGGYGTVSSGTAFNPQISLILDGNFYTDDIGGEGSGLLGEADGITHSHGDHGHEGHEHGTFERGFNLREAELAFSATVDPYFDASAYLAVSEDGDVDLEEAWLQTRALPYGLKVKAGKFLSDIGYINHQHPHQWDFVDQNLAYLNLLGDHGLQDTGVQVTWLPDWPLYTLFGVEALQGEQERLGALAEDEAVEEAAGEAGVDEEALGLSDEDHGPRLFTAFAKVSPDLGYDHALRLGAWTAFAQQHQEVHEEPAIHALEGDAWMWGLDAVYKHSAGGHHGAGDVKLQAEYLWQRKDLDLRFHEANAALVGAERDFTEDGLYVQGVYGLAPRWQVALRYDVVGLTNELESGGTTLTEWDESDRWTAALTWTPTEFSRLRLQYALADISVEGESEDFSSLYLQYIMSLGSHGAHAF
jgi:outer membrane receptor protein involved in Fe transport